MRSQANIKAEKIKRLQRLAEAAKPRQIFPKGNRERDGGDDWGSERQINAQNRLFDYVEKLIPKEKFEELENYCLKATTDEMIAEAMRVTIETLEA